MKKLCGEELCSFLFFGESSWYILFISTYFLIGDGNEKNYGSTFMFI